MAKLTLNGSVTKVTRTGGKPFAQITIQIPASKAGDIPMDEVNITLEATQSTFDDVLPKRVRGDRG